VQVGLHRQAAHLAIDRRGVGVPALDRRPDRMLPARFVGQERHRSRHVRMGLWSDDKRPQGRRLNEHSAGLGPTSEESPAVIAGLSHVGLRVVDPGAERQTLEQQLVRSH
jgi:hypothetical protein